MPLFVMSRPEEEVVTMLVDVAQVAGRHGFECFRWYSGEPNSFCILQFLDHFGEFFTCDGILELPQCPLLCDMFDKMWIGWTVIIVDTLKVWSKDRHIFRGIRCTESVR